MLKRTTAAAGLVGAVALVLAACGGGTDTAAETAATPAETAAEVTVDAGRACVILPDSQSSDRWENQDRPAIQSALEAAGFESDIQNAQGDTNQYLTIGDQMLAGGCGVMILVDLNGSGATVAEKAQAQGIPVIAYDRPFAPADYYVSFNNVRVGQLQGEGLVKCLTDNGVDLAAAQVVFLNGSPTDGNAAMFKEGYETTLADAGITPVKDESVPDWDNQQGGVIYEQMFTDLGGKIDGVLAANDGLGGAAIAVNDKNGVTLPVTGQDATLSGVQNVLLGKQCMTVFKNTALEAADASALAIALLNGERPEVPDTVDVNGTSVPAKYSDPVAVYKDGVQGVLDAGTAGFTAADLCVDAVAAICTELGIK
ncbi:MAG: substrate-binding domain-containing protein [Actinomycetales bacterium]|nr:substrate-binding domain-containing protein [Actinomycetales bacterium]